MRTVGAFEAKNKLSELLDAVQAGEEVSITRHGKPVARLISDTAADRRERHRRAMDEIERLRVGLAAAPLEELIADKNEGRR